MYLAIILLPMLGSVVSGSLGRKVGVSGAQLITCLCVMVTTALAIIGFIEAGLNNTPVSILLFKWVDLESLNVLWGFNYDSLTASMLIPVLIVSSLVHIYSIGYMSHDPHNQRFFSYLSLFTFMMIILVTASNFLLMFVGWEGVGVCSYLLVSFWFTRIAANQSSISAFLTNRVGDCFLTLGMFAMILTFGSLDYSTVFSLAPYVSGDVVTVVGICLLIGAMAKSSQIGLHVWLPLAMEGPTPVSALIHAATMVTAGVYLLMRASPVIEYSSTVLILCLWIGSITTVFSSLIGLFQQDIKKVIAYSTMSQLGMMVIAVGLSSYNIALFHLVNHAFYKGLLFLGAGAVIHAVTDNQDFRKYGGLIGFLPLTYSVMLIASLSLVAFPFMTGFYSKDFILESAYGQFHFYGLAVYFIATIGATFTTLYSVKVLYLTFITNANGPLVNYKKAHEGDVFMSLPLMILAVFSIFFGYITIDIFIGLASGFYADNSLFMHPLHEIMLETEFAVPNIFKLLPLLLTVILSAVSLILSEYLSNLLVKFKFTRLGYNTFSLFNQRFLIELFYNKYITRSILNLGGQTTKVLDKGSVELLGPYGLEKGLLKLSKGLSSLDTGVITSYALYILIGLILYTLMPYICIDHIYILLSIMLILSAITIIIMSPYQPSTFNTSPIQSGFIDPAVLIDCCQTIKDGLSHTKSNVMPSIALFSSAKVRRFSTSVIKLKFDPSNNTNINDLPAGMNTIVAREFYYEETYGRNQQGVRRISETHRTSSSREELNRVLDRTHTDSNELINTHPDMQTRDQHYFNIDTIREAVIDRLMELEQQDTDNNSSPVINPNSNNNGDPSNNDNNGPLNSDSNSAGSGDSNGPINSDSNNGGVNSGRPLSTPTEFVQEIQDNEPIDIKDPDL